jgi:uncharacterized Zn-finger protein
LATFLQGGNGTAAAAAAVKHGQLVTSMGMVVVAISLFNQPHVFLARRGNKKEVHC